MSAYHRLNFGILLCFISTSGGQDLPFSPGDYFLKSRNLEAWEWEVDHDLDGVSTRSEYFAGTDPFDPHSSVVSFIRKTDDGYGLSWNSSPATRFQWVRSPALMTWQYLGDPEIAGEQPGEILFPGEGDREFYSIDLFSPFDTDGDGLSDREETILGTNPENKNTDGDGMDDGFEVLRRFTDPLVFDPPGGTISGKIYLDDDLTSRMRKAWPEKRSASGA